jgi:hypothetical protein
MAKNLQAGLRQSIKASREAGLAGDGVFSRAPLDLRFALQKTLDPRVTFTRASSGTLVGSDGVIKTAVTNLLLRSEEFDNASWTKGNASITANSIAAPNGTLTGAKIVEDTSSATHYARRSTSPTINTSPITFSVYVKAAERTYVGLAIQEATTFTRQSNVNFDLGSGTASTVSNIGGAGSASATITPVGNGWYRCTLTTTLGGTDTGVLSWIYVSTSSGFTYTGDGTSGIYLWGAQLEQSSTVGEYIPTTSTINSAPRFDHNPTTGESLGLLVEEARTNVLLQSQNFSTSWINTGSTSTSGAIAPDGTATAFTVNEGTAVAAAHSTHAVPALTASNIMTLSVHAKNVNARYVGLAISTTSSNNYGTVEFDLDGTGAVNRTAVSGTGFSIISSSISAVGSGWFRCVAVIALGSASVSDGRSTIYVSDGAGSFDNRGRTSYTGTSRTLEIWGAQLEAGAFATSYIPTTTATVTRAADVASITGTNFSSFYNQTEGTVFADGSTSWASGNFVGSSDNTNNNRIFIGIASGPASRLLITTSGSSVAAITVPYALNTLLRGAGGYKENSCQFAANGVLGTEDTNCTIPTVNKLSIGSNTTSNDFFLNGTIKRLTYWPTRFASTTLETITRP